MQKDEAEPFPRCRTEFKKPSLFQKAELSSMTEHLQRNPTYEKGKGRPLPAQGAQLVNLTTIKLSRKKCPESSGRTCVESMLCKVHPELYIPPSTQPIKNAPDLYHSRGWVCCADWKLSRQGWCPVVWWGDLNWLSGLAVVL